MILKSQNFIHFHDLIRRILDCLVMFFGPMWTSRICMRFKHSCAIYVFFAQYDFEVSKFYAFSRFIMILKSQDSMNFWNFHYNFDAVWTSNSKFSLLMLFIIGRLNMSTHYCTIYILFLHKSMILKSQNFIQFHASIKTWNPKSMNFWPFYHVFVRMWIYVHFTTPAFQTLLGNLHISCQYIFVISAQYIIVWLNMNVLS